MAEEFVGAVILEWDGKEIEIFSSTVAESCGTSVTCSKCGLPAIVHSMWVLP